MRSLAWRPYGERGVLFELSSIAEVHELHAAVLRAGIASESIPGAETLYVQSSIGLDPSSLAHLVDSLPIAAAADRDITSHVIDVIYDGDDLPGIAELTGLGIEEVISRHSAPTYTVAFLGFSRAFPYLSGLDPAIVVPRLASPRTLVPAGSVGMGAGFTGIYPAASPGGWRLLGRTEPRFFDPDREPPSVLGVGDIVKFRRVTDPAR
jgi:KipI family sensor histidine kinase inhibitor